MASVKWRQAQQIDKRQAISSQPRPNRSRLLRLSEPETGLALERTLNPNRPLLQQKQQIKALLEAVIRGSDVRVNA